MAKTVSAGMATAVDNRDLNLVACFFVKQRISGTIQGFTEHDRDIAFDLSDGNGEITYQAAAAFSRTAIANTNTFSVDNLEVEGVLDASAFDPDDIDAGKYDRAEIKIFLVDWTDLTLGAIKLRRGHLGEITTAEKGFKAELRGLLQRYTEEIVEVYTPSCRVDLGDPTRCQVRVEPPIWEATTVYTERTARGAETGSVVRPTDDSGSGFNDRHFKCTTAGTSGGTEPVWNTTIDGTTSDGSVTWTTIQALTIETEISAASGSITSNREFVVDYSGDAPDALLTLGLCKFITGNNAGVNIEIKSWTLSTKTVVLYLPAPLDVEVGDTLKLQAGCAKTVAACRDTFDNIYNFQGEPYVPGPKVLFRTPNAQ